MQNCSKKHPKKQCKDCSKTVPINIIIIYVLLSSDFNVDSILGHNNKITSLYVKAKAKVISNNPYNASKKLLNSLLRIQFTFAKLIEAV